MNKKSWRYGSKRRPYLSKPNRSKKYRLENLKKKKQPQDITNSDIFPSHELESSNLVHYDTSSQIDENEASNLNSTNQSSSTSNVTNDSNSLSISENCQRVVDMQHKFDTNAKVNRQTVDSSFLNLRLIKEIQLGLSSTLFSSFHFICENDVNFQPSSMTKEEFEVKKIEFLTHLKLSEKNIFELERRTIDQSNNEEFKKERLSRLTDSSFGKICKLRNNTARKNSVISILYQSYYFHRSSDSSYGIQFKSIAKVDFENMYKCKVLPAGLFVDFHLPFLAASPDGLVKNDSIIEIKCPYLAKEYSPLDAYIQNKLKFMEMKSGSLTLKRNHDYFFQVQGQLHITKKQYCYFVVWTPKGISMEKIKRDDQFWKNKMEVLLSNFYLDHFLPEIINPQFSLDQ